MKFYLRSALIVFCIFYLNVSFNKVDAQNYTGYKIISNTYNFKLDKTQILSSGFIAFDEKANELWRSAKYPKPHIEVIDIKTGKLSKKIFPQRGGCNLFKKMPNGNILIQQEDMYAIMDTNGEILKEFKEPLIGTKNSVDLYTGNSCFSPIHLINDKILITGAIMLLPMKKYNTQTYANWGIVRSFDLNGKMAYKGIMPKQGATAFYGGLNGYCSTENNGKLIIAPYYSNDIQIIDLEKNKITLHKTSTKYDKLIKPLSAIDKYENFTLRQINDYFTSNFSLIGIVYDKYRDLYYRFIRFPGNSIPIKCAIAVMDNQFKTLFYIDIPKDYSPMQFFINNKGILIANNKKYKANDNILTFDLFTLTKQL